MAFGAQILKDDGTLWMSPDVTPMNLYQKFTQSFNADTSLSTTIQLSVPASNPCMVFTRTGGGGIAYGMTQQNGYWSLSITGCATDNGSSGTVNVTFYVFTNLVTVPSRYSAAYYDSAGVMRWHAEMRPLQIFQRSVSGLPGRGSFDAGFTSAVSSIYSGLSVVNYAPGTPPVYYWGSWAWRSTGSSILELPVYIWNTTSGSTYTQWGNSDVLYINAGNYD
ncbi:MAG: hypothetical protein KIB40_02695 [Pantoea sp.]|uniref:hypothetical protein n=1 Tax=Pantoea sp. TaxID=69393 RepID=UPI002580C719|nr:hypothetical protein [Pantoea sp.]MBS6032054.1 hypothetical protein [Pantoea sp.]